MEELFMVLADGQPWIDADGRDSWPWLEADTLAAMLETEPMSYDVEVIPA